MGCRPLKQPEYEPEKLILKAPPSYFTSYVTLVVAIMLFSQPFLTSLPFPFQSCLTSLPVSSPLLFYHAADPSGELDRLFILIL